MATGYLIPALESSAEHVDKGSRFLGVCACVDTVGAAKAFVASMKTRYADASHHVYAFAVGHGASVTHGMSDDGEPSNTAGRPVLAVVQGSDWGDLIVVVMRWWGGTKLGTGGLVRAYTKAAQDVLAVTPSTRKVELVTAVVRVPYDRYEVCREALRRSAEENADNAVEITSEDFAADATLHLSGPQAAVEAALVRFTDLTSGRAEVIH